MERPIQALGDGHRLPTLVAVRFETGVQGKEGRRAGGTEGGRVRGRYKFPTLGPSDLKRACRVRKEKRRGGGREGGKEGGKVLGDGH